MNRRTLFKRLLAAACVVALAPQIAFRTPLAFPNTLISDGNTLRFLTPEQHAEMKELAAALCKALNERIRAGRASSLGDWKHWRKIDEAYASA